MKKFILLFFLLSGSLLADDLVVDGTGIVPNSYLTITEALSAASEGDNILVSPSMAGGYRNENLVIDKSVSIYPLVEGQYFSMERNIMINLDDVLEFSIIGGLIDAKIEANLINEARVNNTTVNIVDCVLMQNVYLNYITCITNIFKSIRMENSDMAYDNYWIGTNPATVYTYNEGYNPNYSGCSYWNSNPLNSYNWVDMYVQQPNCTFNDLDNFFTTSYVLDKIPTISINSGNVVASEFFKLIIGHGDAVWQNSPIVNDTIVNIVANKLGILLFDNPSYSFSIKNNQIKSFHSTSSSNVLNSISPNYNGVPLDQLVHELTDGLSNSSVYWRHSAPNVNDMKSYSRIFIFSAKDNMNSYIHNNHFDFGDSDGGTPIGIDNLGFDHSNLTVFNNQFDGVSAFASNSSWFNNSFYVWTDNCSNGENIKGNIFLFRNFNPEFNDMKLWYNGGVYAQNNDYYCCECGTDMKYNYYGYTALDYGDGGDHGHPSFEFTDLDLTRNDIGIEGGSNPWSMFHSSSIGKGRVFWLNIPQILSDPTNFQIKAKGAHLK